MLLTKGKNMERIKSIALLAEDPRLDFKMAAVSFLKATPLVKKERADGMCADLLDLSSFLDIPDYRLGTLGCIKEK
jgi:hypothetical protein